MNRKELEKQICSRGVVSRNEIAEWVPAKTTLTLLDENEKLEKQRDGWEAEAKVYAQSVGCGEEKIAALRTENEELIRQRRELQANRDEWKRATCFDKLRVAIPDL